MKFLFIRAIIVKGMTHARKRSAQAKFAKYLLLVKRIGPREANITISAAVLPSKAKKKIRHEIPFVIHAASLEFV